MSFMRELSSFPRNSAMKRIGYHINVKERTITQVTFESLADMQKLIGGFIECAYRWPSGDVLYVDEEGLFKDNEFFGLAERYDQLLAGNGLMVGPEIDVNNAEGFTNAPPVMPIEQLIKRVIFMGV